MRRSIELLALTTLIAAFAVLPARADWADDDVSDDDDDDDVECTVDANETDGFDCFDCVALNADEGYCALQHGDSDYDFVCSRDDQGEHIEVWCAEDTNESEPAPGCAHLLSPRVPTMAIPVLMTGLFTLLVLAWRRED